MSSLVKVNVNFANIGKEIQDAVARGVDTAVVEMGREMQIMLSKPGTGRVYIRKDAKGKLNSRAIRILRNAGVSPKRGRHFAYASRSQVAQALRVLRNTRKNPKTLRSIGFHKASAPGQPPARDTGNLARSWQTGFKSRGSVQRNGREYVLVVGSNVKYARWLEFGTSRMAARPYVRPVAEIMRKRAPLIINSVVAKAVAKMGGRKK